MQENNIEKLYENYSELRNLEYYLYAAANKFDDRFLVANNKEILNNIKLLTEYFKKLS